MKGIRIFTVLLALLFLPASLWAADFGLVAGMQGGLGNSIDNDDSRFDFKMDLWPRYSALIGDNAEFSISAGFTINADDDVFFVPELLLTEFSMLFGASGIRLGRINYSDPLTYVAEGIFDGAQFFYNSQTGNFNIGVWYTGLLYKKNAYITMTNDDEANFHVPLDFDNFSDTYFASRRMIAALGWEHPSISELLHLKTAFIAQVDLNDVDEKYNSQYVILKAAVPVNNFLIELGGGLEFSSGIGFAGEIGLFWLFPSVYNSRLSFTGKIAGGKADDIEAFNPITTKSYGSIFKHRMSGISVFALNYSSRFNQTTSGSFNASYFVRNDLGTFNGYPISADSGDGYFLGPEIFAGFAWNPFSDLQFNVGGGAFIPSLGDTAPDAKVLWRTELSVTLAIF